ncbi:para-aminobenzoate synthetase component 1 [Pseudoxanthobacter soli DSM 19599]|uniref:aminodeoxychorismate synthase n=1 Tax=Pseudoxanthobacter soli DSM 19599 TaxID=1123029 RepID=A0A1M7Z4U4_9HYPH|nr:aminodeoxychorismate synthase component I [Pseudoxanthobacter soli]SHO59895.1 para-aminobenzoate synthetase component 1 [Pseudoxanthobacter soli DSM 19599]
MNSLVTDLGPLDPVETLLRFQDQPGLSFLDSAMAHPELGRFSFVSADPFAEIAVRDGRLFLDGIARPGHPLDALGAVLAPFRTDTLPGLPPFQGGALGFFSYEFGHCLERLPEPTVGAGSVPQAAFHLFDWTIAFDHRADRAWLISTGFPDSGPACADRAATRRDAVLSRLRAPLPVRPTAPRLPWRADTGRDAHEAAVARTIELVLAGDIFQANIARRFSAPLPTGFPPLAFYLDLRARNPATFAAYLDFAPVFVASSSPERFLKLAGRQVETRPIKGTAPRASDPDEDAAAAAALAASVKDRAENVMIVDLMRNDLSRVAEPGSVAVPVLCGVESYAGLHHLVSVVRATLSPDRDGLNLVAAAFPGGSITGAPKVRAMEIIGALEGRARGVYCGSIGYLGFDGAMDLNIAIRTVTFADGEASFQTGGGITALSDPAAEFAETLTKASRMLAQADLAGIGAP